MKQKFVRANEVLYRNKPLKKEIMKISISKKKLAKFEYFRNLNKFTASYVRRNMDSWKGRKKFLL